jgi:hypothetical protein
VSGDLAYVTREGKAQISRSVKARKTRRSNEELDAKLTRTDEIPADAGPEVVEDSVSMSLEHPRVRVEARVAELGDLLGEELDSVRRVAEDDGLVNLKLSGREGGKTYQRGFSGRVGMTGDSLWKRGC